MLFGSVCNSLLDAENIVQNWNEFWELFQSIFNAISSTNAFNVILRFLTRCLQFINSTGDIITSILDNMTSQAYWEPLSSLFAIILAFIGLRIAIDLL